MHPSFGLVWYLSILPIFFRATLLWLFQSYFIKYFLLLHPVQHTVKSFKHYDVLKNTTDCIAHIDGLVQDCSNSIANAIIDVWEQATGVFCELWVKFCEWDLTYVLLYPI